MKKFVLMVVAMMSLSMGFAKTGNHSEVNDADRYDMTIDMRRLAATLDLDENQMDAVQVIHEIFTNEMQSASAVRYFERPKMVHEAVRKDVHHMHSVLNDKQFRTYMVLLMTTLRNRGL